MNNTLLKETLSNLGNIAYRSTKGERDYLAIAKELKISIKGLKKAQAYDLIKEEIERRLTVKEISKALTYTWKKKSGAYGLSQVKFWLNKIKATTPMEFNDDSRFDLTDKLPVIRGTQKATITIEKLISYANKIKEESTMQNNTTKQPLSQEDREMLNKIANAKEETRRYNESKKEYFKAKRKADREAMLEQAQQDIENENISNLEFFEKLVRLQNIAKYLQETRYERRCCRKFNPIEGKTYDFSKAKTERVKEFKKHIKRNKIVKITFNEMYNEDVNTLGNIIKNSFDTQELASKENFEKNTEFVKLIDNVLIKAGVFDYKVKDSEINTPYEVADVLLAEQIDIAYNNKCAYHVRESAKEENNLKAPSKKQLDLIMNVVWKYRKVNGGASPKMPVSSLSQITSSVLASAILEKYAYYVDLKVDMPTLNQAEKLFDRFVRWNVANSQMRNAFISKVMLELSFQQAKTLIEITYTDMWLITRYAKDNGIKIFEACFKVANMQQSTRSSAVQYYQQLEFRQRMSLYNLEDDK